jgi:hypothetical protein
MWRELLMFKTVISRAFVISIILLIISSFGLYYLNDNPGVSISDNINSEVHTNLLGYLFAGSIMLFIIAIILMAGVVMAWIFKW